MDKAICRNCNNFNKCVRGYNRHCKGNDPKANEEYKMKYVLYLKGLGYFHEWSDKYADMFLINGFDCAKRLTKEDAEKLKAYLVDIGYEVNIESENRITNDDYITICTTEERAELLTRISDSEWEYPVMPSRVQEWTNWLKQPYKGE